MLMLILTGSSCRREALHETEGTLSVETSSINGSLLRLDTLVYANPERVSDNIIRFDLLTPVSPLAPGTLFIYPAGDGVVGRVVESNQNHSRVYLTIDKPDLFDLFDVINNRWFISTSSSDLSVPNTPFSKQGDTIRWSEFRMAGNPLGNPWFSVDALPGHLVWDEQIECFLAGGPAPDQQRSVHRYSLESDFEVSFRSGFHIEAHGAVVISDSLRIREDRFGPYKVEGVPVTFVRSTWMGYHANIPRQGLYHLDASGSAQGRTGFRYAGWTGWESYEKLVFWEASIDSVNGTEFQNYLMELFFSTQWHVLLGGDTLASFRQLLSGRSLRTIDTPKWSELRMVDFGASLFSESSLLAGYLPGTAGSPGKTLYEINLSGENQNTPPVPAFSINPGTGNTSTNFEFNAESTRDLEDLAEDIEVRWDFDGDDHYDTEFSTQKIAFRRYTTPGFYQIVLEARDKQGLTARITRNLNVELSQSAPTAYFTVSPETGGTNNYFILDASLSHDLEDPLDLLKVRWDFDDDGIWDTQFSANKIEVKTYPVAGTYIIKLEVKDSQGLTGSTTRMLVVTAANIKPTAIFTVSPESGTTQTIFSFDASESSDPEDPAEDLMVQWDFNNDGVWDTDYRQEKTINHRYLVAGTYTAVLRVKDTEDFASTYSLQLTVTDPNRPPEADFTITPATGTTADRFLFDASVSTDPEDTIEQMEFRWDLNNDGRYDTEYSTDPTYRIQYNEPGTYLIKLQVKDSGGLTDTKVRLLIVT